ncbi:MAG: ABC transporter substrate-binding protein [Gammaproteobacteria bacterium]|nr:ABC transporter substrate-binding protein [Gammaproteobacteria bacterium]
MKNLLLVLLLSCGFTSAVWANQAPDQLVQETSKQMLAKLKEERDVIKKNPERIYDLVQQIVLPHFDFEYMSQLVLAKNWKRATDAQRKAFVSEFRTLLVRTYATSLNEYTDQKLTYLPFRQNQGDTEVTVRTEVEQPGGLPIPIDYRLHQRDNEWIVFDVIIDNVSLVSNYRTTFAKEVRQGDIDGLIKTLVDRNKQARRE